MGAISPSCILRIFPGFCATTDRLCPIRSTTSYLPTHIIHCPRVRASVCPLCGRIITTIYFRGSRAFTAPHGSTRFATRTSSISAAGSLHYSAVICILPPPANPYFSYPSGQPTRVNIPVRQHSCTVSTTTTTTTTTRTSTYGSIPYSTNASPRTAPHRLSTHCNIPAACPTRPLKHRIARVPPSVSAALTATAPAIPLCTNGSTAIVRLVRAICAYDYSGATRGAVD